MSTQQPQEVITALKASLYDVNVELQNQHSIINELSAAFNEISRLLGIEANEQGQVKISDVVEAVVALVTPDDAQVEND